MEELLSKRLEDYAFYKSVLSDPMEEGNAAFDFKLWRDAEHRGIAETVTLREAAHGSCLYRVFAYSMHGEIPAQLLAQLSEIVNGVDLDEIRYEAVGVQGFSLVYDDQGECFQEDYTLLPLYRQMDGVFLAVVAEDAGDAGELDCPLAAYAVNGDGMYHWCVAQRYLEPDYSYPPTDEDPDSVEEGSDEDVLDLLNGVLGTEGADLSAYAQMMGGMQSQQEAMDMAGAFFAMGAEAAQGLPGQPTEADMMKAYQEMMAKQMSAFGAMMGSLHSGDEDDETHQ